MLKEIIKYGEAELTYRGKLSFAEKPALYNLFWETTLRCNAKCKHCGSRAGENINVEDELTTDEIKGALKSIANKYNARNIFLDITGGEPLVRQDLFEVMKFASELGYNWGMTTNGILIDDEIVTKMKDSKMGSVSISLDGLKKTHDEFRGVEDSYSKIIENIKKLKLAKFLKNIQVTTVVNKANINELEELYSVISSLKIDSWRLLNMDPIGRAIDNNNLALTSKDYKYLIEFIKSKRKKAKFDVTYGCSHYLGMQYEKEVRKHMFHCIAGYTAASILYNGDIYVCPSVERRKELIQGNVRIDDFVDVWENKFKWFRECDKLKCEDCINCESWRYCKGDSLHTWDFDLNKPKICLNNILKEMD